MPSGCPAAIPELHAGALASAERFKHGMRELAARDIPIHGECGGYMVLGAGLETADGQRHAMLGLLGLETSFRQRRLHLGYRRARLLPNSAAALAASELWGHEFHYSTVVANPDLPLADIVDAMGDAVAERGSRRGSRHGHVLPPHRRDIERRRDPSMARWVTAPVLAAQYLTR